MEAVLTPHLVIHQSMVMIFFEICDKVCSSETEFKTPYL